ncbi:MAG TPA: hypothetical protein VIL48_17425 [Acidimicrobiales bacterium]
MSDDNRWEDAASDDAEPGDEDDAEPAPPERAPALLWCEPCSSELVPGGPGKFIVRGHYRTAGGESLFDGGGSG